MIMNQQIKIPQNYNRISIKIMPKSTQKNGACWKIVGQIDRKNWKISSKIHFFMEQKSQIVPQKYRIIWTKKLKIEIKNIWNLPQNYL